VPVPGLGVIVVGLEGEGMAQVLEAAAALSDRAQAFLAGRAQVVVVDTGPDDDECRAAMDAVLGYRDERALTALRRTQRRYSGLTYPSPFRGCDIVFEPIFEVDAVAGRITFDSTIMDRAPDGCRYGFMLPDGTVWFGYLDRSVPAFPSLDHFLEFDALLDYAQRQDLQSTAAPPDANAHREALLDRHPELRRLDAASGFCVEWWTDGERLVYFDGLDARLAADGRGASWVPTVVKIWLFDEPTA
jgi:hypothetical protein